MNANTLTKRRVVFQIFWRVVLFFVTFALISAAFFLPLTLAKEWAKSWSTEAQLYADIAGALAMLVATWIMLRFIDRRAFRTIGFGRINVARDLAGGLLLGTAWLVVSLGGAWLAGWAAPQAPATFSLGRLSVAAVSVLFNVVTQQFLLCGYILQTIQSRSNFLIALLVSAALFSSYHVGAFHGAMLPAVNVFAAGTLFCLAYGITGNLWLPVSMHFAWNFLLGPALGLTISGTGGLGLGWSLFAVKGPSLFTGGDFGLEGGLVVTLTTVVFIIALALFGSRPARQKILEGALDPLRSL